MTIEFGRKTKYDILISPSNNNGFIVRVGCCTTVYNNVDDMINAIKDYLNNPNEIEEMYNKKFQNQAMAMTGNMLTTQPNLNIGCVSEG